MRIRVLLWWPVYLAVYWPRQWPLTLLEIRCNLVGIKLAVCECGFELQL